MDNVLRISWLITTFGFYLLHIESGGMDLSSSSDKENQNHAHHQ